MLTHLCLRMHRRFFHSVIFLRRPYRIGDRIHISDPIQDTDRFGSAGWIVKDINLFSTTVVFGSTNEVSCSSGGAAVLRYELRCTLPDAIGVLCYPLTDHSLPGRNLLEWVPSLRQDHQRVPLPAGEPGLHGEIPHQHAPPEDPALPRRYREVHRGPAPGGKIVVFFVFYFVVC